MRDDVLSYEELQDVLTNGFKPDEYREYTDDITCRMIKGYLENNPEHAELIPPFPRIEIHTDKKEEELKAELRNGISCLHSALKLTKTHLIKLLMCKYTIEPADSNIAAGRARKNKGQVEYRFDAQRPYGWNLVTNTHEMLHQIEAGSPPEGQINLLAYLACMADPQSGINKENLEHRIGWGGTYTHQTMVFKKLHDVFKQSDSSGAFIGENVIRDSVLKDESLLKNHLNEILGEKDTTDFFSRINQLTMEHDKIADDNSNISQIFDKMDSIQEEIENKYIFRIFENNEKRLIKNICKSHLKDHMQPILTTKNNSFDLCAYVERSETLKRDYIGGNLSDQFGKEFEVFDKALEVVEDSIINNLLGSNSNSKDQKTEKERTMLKDVFAITKKLHENGEENISSLNFVCGLDTEAFDRYVMRNNIFDCFVNPILVFNNQGEIQHMYDRLSERQFEEVDLNQDIRQGINLDSITNAPEIKKPFVFLPRSLGKSYLKRREDMKSKEHGDSRPDR